MEVEATTTENRHSGLSWFEQSPEGGEFFYVAGAGSTSAFASDNEAKQIRADMFEEFGAVQSAFRRLILSRIQYVDGLRDLGDDWISGGAKAPSESAIQMARALLVYVMFRTQTELLSVLPRLVLGPLPGGGVEVELHAEEDSAIYVAFNNDSSVEIDTKLRGYFSKVETPISGQGNEIFARYESITQE